MGVHENAVVTPQGNVAGKEGQETRSEVTTALDTSPLGVFKYCYAVVLLIWSIFIIMGLMFTGQTSLAKSVHPALAFVVCWGLLTWLSMVEGGQCSLVGLPPVDRALYKDSHPITYKICEFAHKGNNLDRYLMGRQFLVVFIVFFINLSAAPFADANIFGLPDWVVVVFLQTGISMILLTAQVGQLAAQCNASHMMLDYINNYFMVFTLAVSIALEFSGLLHASYVIQYAVAAIAGKPIESKEPPRTVGQNIFFWGRCLMSVGILGFSIAVTITALFEGKTTMWSSIPNGVAVVLFFILMNVVGLLEGMQIAFFAVSKMTKEERGEAKCAKMTCDLLFDAKGHNLPGFMIGRQMCVVGCMFIVARVCTLNVEVGTGNNVFGVSDGFQSFLNTGLLAALITTIIGSIAWQLVAGAFPIAFLSNPVVYFFLRWCLFLESTGICNGAWVIGRVAELIMGWKTDEHYIGTAEQRKLKADLKVDLEAVDAWKQATQVCKGWKDGYNQEELQVFCQKLSELPSDVARAGQEGQSGSGVTNIADVAKDYVPSQKSDRFPTAQQMAEVVVAEQGEIPCFLLPASHPRHVPPHLVAIWLMAENAKLKSAAI